MVMPSMCKDTVVRDNKENFHSSASIRKRAVVSILLPLAILSGCALFEEPVYNRYGKLFDTVDDAQEPETENQATKPVESFMPKSKDNAFKGNGW